MTEVIDRFVGDACFLLSSFPATARVVAGPASWSTALVEAGVEVVDHDDAEVVVAPAAAGDDERVRAAQAALLIGRPRAVRPGGRRYAVLEDELGALYAVPVLDRRARRRIDDLRGRPAGARTALRRRARVVTGLVGLSPSVSVRDRAGLPMLLRATREAGLTPGGPWFLTVQPFPRSRRAAIVHLGATAGDDVVVKFSRVRGDTIKGDREVRGHAVAATAGDVVLRHVPALLGGGSAAGFHFVAQRCARGLPLYVLNEQHRREESIRHLDEVARWLREVATATARRRTPHEPGVDAAASATGAPAIVQHGDLTDQHVFVRADGFDVIDWELATASGYPLWDLLYLAITSLPVLDGARTEADHAARAVDLLRGRARSSAPFFAWVRAEAGSLGLGPVQVVQLIDAALHHYADPARGEWSVAQHLLEAWLRLGDLGDGWTAWR